MPEPTNEKEWPEWRKRLRHVIFDHHTPASKAFDIVLLIVIVCSLVVVMLDTVPSMNRYNRLFWILEWAFTIIFTIEYILRLYISRRPLRYACSFFGIVDLLSCLPAYLTLLGSGRTAYAGVVRTLRPHEMFRLPDETHHL